MQHHLDGALVAALAIAVPRWMAALQSCTAPRAVAVGLFLVVANPKNLLLTASAGLSVGSASSQVLVVGALVAVVTLVASGPVLLLVTAHLIAGRTVSGHLPSVRRWLQRRSSVISSAVFLALGGLFVVLALV